MAGNRGVRYMGPGKVEVADLDYPGLELQDGPGVNPANVGRKTPHGVILKTVATNLSLNYLSRYRKRWRFFSEFKRDDDSDDRGAPERQAPTARLARTARTDPAGDGRGSADADPGRRSVSPENRRPGLAAAHQGR